MATQDGVWFIDTEIAPLENTITHIYKNYHPKNLTLREIQELYKKKFKDLLANLKTTNASQKYTYYYQNKLFPY